MTLDQLRTFRAAAQLKSFTRAAERLHLTQPAVSAQIVALEKEFRVKLFDRIGKTVVLTEAGQIMLTSAEGILGHIQTMQQAFEDLAGLGRGQIRIGASNVVGIYLLPEILGRFKKKYPPIDLMLEINYARHIIDQVLANRVDLGIVGEGAPLTDERLSVKRFAQDEFVVIAPKQHAWAKRQTIAPAELAKQPFVITERGSATQESGFRLLEAQGVKLNVMMELGNIEGVKKAVEAGLGISIVSRCAILKEVEANRLKALPLSGLALQRNLSFVWRKGKHFSRATHTFIDFFLTCLNASKGASPKPILANFTAGKEE